MTMRQLLGLWLSLLAFAGPPLCAGQTASDKELFQAVAKGDMGAVRVSLDNGAEIDARDEQGDTPVMVAVGNNNIAMVKLLLEKGADVSLRNKYEETALIQAARSFDSEMLEVVLRGNPNIEEKNAALLQAAESGPVVIQTVEAPPTANGQHEQATTVAPEPSWVTNVRLLLDSGANIEARDDEGETPLMRAAAYGQTQIFSLLLEKGAKVNVRDKRGMTPLIAAACACAVATMNSTHDIMKILLEKGANVNARDNGRSALMLAASGPDDPSSVKLLLNNGADPFAKDNRGYTPLTFALKGTRPEKAPLLRKAMAKAH